VKNLKDPSPKTHKAHKEKHIEKKYISHIGLQDATLKNEIHLLYM